MSALSSKKPSKLILYTLNYPRSTRLVWLLKELGVDYDLEICEFTKDMNAPPELKKIHPLGKVPIVIDNGKMITESGIIAQYLLSKFDKDNKLTPKDASEQQVNYFIQYSEASLQPLWQTVFVINIIKTRLPWGLGYLGGYLLDVVLDAFYQPQISRHLDYLEDYMQGRIFFVGDKLTAADIMLAVTLNCLVTNDWVKRTKNYPNLQKWLEMIESNENYQKSDKIVKAG